MVIEGTIVCHELPPIMNFGLADILVAGNMTYGREYEVIYTHKLWAISYGRYDIID